MILLNPQWVRDGVRENSERETGRHVVGNYEDHVGLLQQISSEVVGGISRI